MISGHCHCHCHRHCHCHCHCAHSHVTCRSVLIFGGCSLQIAFSAGPGGANGPNGMPGRRTDLRSHALLVSKLTLIHHPGASHCQRSASISSLQPSAAKPALISKATVGCQCQRLPAIADTAFARRSTDTSSAAAPSSNLCQHPRSLSRICSFTPAHARAVTQ